MFKMDVQKQEDVTSIVNWWKGENAKEGASIQVKEGGVLSKKVNEEAGSGHTAVNQVKEGGNESMTAQEDATGHTTNSLWLECCPDVAGNTFYKNPYTQVISRDRPVGAGTEVVSEAEFGRRRATADKRKVGKAEVASRKRVRRGWCDGNPPNGSKLQKYKLGLLSEVI